MSRHNRYLDEVTVITRGFDHALGPFVQVCDGRWAVSPKDIQGEGFVLDYDKLFGFGINLIGATEDDLLDDKKLKDLTNKFCSTL